MTSLRLASIVAVLFGLAQSPRDTLPAPASGTAIISGVVRDELGVPLGNVQILAGTQASKILRGAQTDANGRYTIDRLPAATYMLVATMPGFTTTAFGTSRASGSPVPIVLTDGDRFVADFTLTRMSVLSGTVLDEYGAPTVATVALYTRRPVNFRGSPLARMREVESDRQGRYRLEGLPADNYLVRAERSNVPDDVRRIEGGVERTVTYLPVYYPGVTSSTAARPVLIEPGVHRSGIDLQLQTAATTSFEGTLVDGSGNQLVSATTRLVGDDESVDRFGSTADGRFQFVGVPAGRYVLAARAPLSPTEGEKRRVLWGSLEVFVSPDAPVSPSLTLHAGAGISGQVVFDGNAPIAEFRRLPQPLVQLVSMSGVFSRFAAADVVIGSDDPAAGPRPFKTTIRFDNVAPGRVVILAGLFPPSGWSLRSILINGVDVAAIPFDVKPGQQIEDLVVTLTDRPTTLSGTIKNEIGDPVFAHTVVVFPVDARARWEAPGARIKTTRPDSRGKYTVSGLPAGDYLIGLARDLNPARIVLAELLNSLEAAAVRVRLVEGEETVQNLQTRDR